MGIWSSNDLVRQVRAFKIMAAAVSCFMSVASMSQGPPAADAKADGGQRGAQCNLITKDQAESILSELRQVNALLQQQTQPQQRQSSVSQRVQMAVASDWHSIGAEQAPVTIIEFTDLVRYSSTSRAAAASVPVTGRAMPQIVQILKWLIEEAARATNLVTRRTSTAKLKSIHLTIRVAICA